MAKQPQLTHLGENQERERRKRRAEAAKARRLAMAPLDDEVVEVLKDIDLGDHHTAIIYPDWLATKLSLETMKKVFADPMKESERTEAIKNYLLGDAKYTLRPKAEGIGWKLFVGAGGMFESKKRMPKLVWARPGLLEGDLRLIFKRRQRDIDADETCLCLRAERPKPQQQYRKDLTLEELQAKFPNAVW
jgi:hypothetical protein